MKASLLALWLAFFVPAILQAQEEELPPEDAFNRGTPLSSAKGFLIATSDQDFETAANYLDLRNLPSQVSAEDGPELARQLDFILGRAIWLDEYELDDTRDGEQGDGLPEYRDLFASIPDESGDTDLYMQRVPREDGVMIWKISNRSVAEIPVLYAHYANPAWVEEIREALPDDAGFLGLELYKWVIGIIISLLAWPVFHFLGVLLSRLLLKPDHHLYPFLRSVMTRPAVALAVVLTLGFVIRQLGMGAVAQKYADAKTLVIIISVWTIWSVLGLFQKYKSERLMQDGRIGAAKILRPAINLVRLLVVVIAFLLWLSNLGVNISTLLAGLGVGGLALALALQKPLEDLMGAFTLFTQQPVRVGDFCKYGAVTGTVEEIGLRTTRIRTLNDTLVCVPNAKISISDIENYSERHKFFYKPVLRLRYDTSTAQIRSIIENIEGVLKGHESVLKEDTLRVKFRDFAEDAILIRIQSYVDCKDITEFFEISEYLNLKIMEAVEEEGASFALPGRMIYGTPGSSPQLDQ